jgi:hypothetical protein
MSMMWKYINSNNDSSIIDTIYCSQIKMTIPIEYYWTVLLKDGSEYDLTNPILRTILKELIDLDAFAKAKENYLKLL